MNPFCTCSCTNHQININDGFFCKS